MRVGRFSFRQRWIDREVSPSLTAAVVFFIAMGGFVLGFGTVRWLDDGFGFGRCLASSLGDGGEVSGAVSVPFSVNIPVLGLVLGSELRNGTAGLREHMWLVDGRRTESELGEKW
jgi:hypothetical protein